MFVLTLGACNSQAWPPAPRNTRVDSPSIVPVEATGLTAILSLQNPTSSDARTIIERLPWLPADLGLAVRLATGCGLAKDMRSESILKTARQGTVAEKMVLL